MHAHVLGLGHHLKVRGVVVELVAVDVMNDLAPLERTPKGSLRDSTVFMTSAALPISEAGPATTKSVAALFGRC